MESMEKCPLCDRVLIEGPSVNAHHLVPRSLRGRVTVKMHRICHAKIHSVFSERELALYYHTCQRLLENHDIRKFVDWVQRKDPAYYDRHRSAARRR